MGDFNSKSLTISVLLIIIALFGGMFLGRYSSPSSQQVDQPDQYQAQKAISNIVDSQSASLQGEVTKIEGSNLTIKNQKGDTYTFSASSKFIVYKFNAGSTQASASAGLNSVSIGKKAQISLEFIDGKYQVVSVSYLPAPK